MTAPVDTWFGISPLNGPCWEVVRADGSPFERGSGSTHYDSEADATEAAAELADEEGETDLSAVELPHRCFAVTAFCGKTLGNDDFAAEHFTARRWAMDEALEREWVITSDGTLRCPKGECGKCWP